MAQIKIISTRRDRHTVAIPKATRCKLLTMQVSAFYRYANMALPNAAKSNLRDSRLHNVANIRHTTSTDVGQRHVDPLDQTNMMSGVSRDALLLRFYVYT